MSKTTSFVGALGAFGALAYLMAPLPPEAPQPRTAEPTSVGTAVVAAPVAVSVPPQHTETPPPVPNTSVRLVRQIQSELLRLGCYSGAVDGQWSPETQRAMHTLGERVRVLRPLDKPDYIMLALARSQESHVCAPHHRTTASRQPARIVPMVGPWTTRTEHDRAVARAKRVTERAQGMPTQVLRRSPPPAQPVTQRAASPDTATQGSSAFLANPDTGRQIPSGLEQSRMGLGAAPIDPLRAGIDPRDPSAPAILRGPAPVAQGGAIAGDDAKTDAAPSPRLAARDAQIATPSRRRQSDWKRNVFRNLSESGP